MNTAEPELRRRDIRRIGQVDVNVFTREEMLAGVVAAVKECRSGVWGFCNAHTVNMAEGDAEFRKAVQSMTMFNDGIGVDIASRWLYGSSFPENLNGTDLTPALLDALPDGTPVFLVGGQPEVVIQACQALEKTHPNIRIAGWHHGYFGLEEAGSIVDHITASDARLVLVGMGHPRQEKWAVAHASGLNVPIMCVGALIDRVAGRVPRAPLWMRRLNLEWFFRLILEPRRLAKRYLWGNAVFLYRVRRQRAVITEKRTQVRA